VTDYERIVQLEDESYQDWMRERRKSYQRQERAAGWFLTFIVLCIIGWSIWEVVR